MIIFFLIYVPEGNLQWNSWICNMIDYLKGPIVRFKLNFENALEMWNRYNDDKYQVKQWCV